MRKASRATGRGRRRWATRALLLPLALVASSCIATAEWVPQDVAPSVAPLVDRFVLKDVACPAPGACVAVGSVGTVPVGSEALVLRQAGDGWERVPVPVPLHTLERVSCRGVDDCVLLGYVDFAFDGEQVTTLPYTPGATINAPEAVDCVPGAGCLVVVGNDSSVWWDGASWSEPVPLPSGLMPVDPHVSCTSPTACLLVTTQTGLELLPTPGTVTSSTWDGTAWSPVVTLDHDTRVLALDCATPTACFATAGVRADNWTHLIPPVPAEVLRWDGAAWSIESITNPGGVVPTEPGTVSCASGTACTVLSVVGESDPPSPTVLAEWNGSAWSGRVTDAASPATALSCTGPSDCTATGPEVAQRFDGATWSSTDLPSGTSPAEAFDAVSCAGEDDCVAVGAGWTLQHDAGPLQTPATHHFDGDDWSLEDPGGGVLRHVSCPATTSCMAAGGESGTVWTRHRDASGWRALPDLTESGMRATGLSCATASWCLLTTAASGTGEDRAWIWEGGASWSEIAGFPEGTRSTVGVSCVAPGDCVVVSTRVGGGMYHLAGGTWEVVPLDDADVASIPRFEDVDCTAVDECVVVGTARIDGGLNSPRRAWLGVLADGGWSSTLRTTSDFILDVDCWAVDGCVAVASGLGPTGWSNSELVVWDGESWRSVEGPPAIARPTAVSCAAPGRCEVVGAWVDGDDRAVAASVVIDL